MADDPVPPREVIAFDKGTHTFRKSDYPWLVATRVIVVPSEAASGISPGTPGSVLVELYDREPWPANRRDG